MSNQIIKRDDAIYKEIEEFKDYELTQCIAYEMMIRNDEFKKDRLNIIEDVKPFMLKIDETEKERDKPSYTQAVDDLWDSDDYTECINNAVNKSKKWGITIHEMKNAYNLEFLFLKRNHQYFKENNNFIWDKSTIDLNKDITNHYSNQASRPSIEIKNVGEREGSEVVQLYIRDIVGSIGRPMKELKGFKK